MSVTIVTGIWDIKRDTLSEGWNRGFQHYLNHLEKLMRTDDNMIIYIEKKYRSFVEERRPSHNTVIIERELDWFLSNGDLYQKITSIRLKPDWYNQSGWLPDSTQARLEYYNLIVMCKMFLLNDAALMDPFNSSHLVWIDGALTNTVHDGYFWKDRLVTKLSKYFNKFTFVSFPYDGKVEIHGFTYGPLCEYAGAEVDKVCRGGIFGGPKSAIRKANEIYYNLLNETLSAGYMGTEESVFTIMLYRHPELFQFYSVQADGLLFRFFESVKTGDLIPKIQMKSEAVVKQSVPDSVALYVITYNSPRQLETLCKSMEIYDNSFLSKTKKYLLNNSLDRSTDEAYAQLCSKYDFEEIKKDNLGICGGRQFIAEHFDSTDYKYYMFFEDDMNFYVGQSNFCKNGFKRKIDNLLDKIVHIMNVEEFDFLKLNFTEFYGDNSTQWSWYNVPQAYREIQWPNNPRLPEQGLSQNAPKTLYKNIKSYEGLPYASGEVYYCNWPQIVSREGNIKMFLNTKWGHPFEQTWMSYIYQETVKGDINPGILLATPTEHDRFDHYKAEERKES